MYQLQKLELGWKIYWMSMYGMSDVEIGHIQMFLVFQDQGECFWHLEWKIKGEPEQNEHIYRYQVNGFLITCPAKQEHFRTKLRPLMGKQVDRTVEERSL